MRGNEEQLRGLAVRIRGVEKSFPNGEERLQVLRDINIDVGAGETVSITGESGSGKSTLLSLVAGLDQPEQGEIIVGAERVDRLQERELTRYRAVTVGLVFQFHYLLRDFSALENVMLPALMQNRPAAEAEERARKLLRQVGLSDRDSHYPPQLSGGERQRVAAARALVNDPLLILADEPTGNLDDYNSQRVEDTLLSLVSDHGKTLIVVTHNPALAARAARTFHLEKGCLVSR
ncbi:MAG: ABC transporter ATP-binding protein [Spirochaetaceae bacterium]|nr:MAG: ABC transporter ATP-binding protein [Spirochaetaceae bacterium]